MSSSQPASAEGQPLDRPRREILRRAQAGKGLQDSEPEEDHAEGEAQNEWACSCQPVRDGEINPVVPLTPLRDPDWVEPWFASVCLKSDAILLRHSRWTEGRDCMRG